MKENRKAIFEFSFIGFFFELYFILFLFLFLPISHFSATTSIQGVSFIFRFEIFVFFR